jgi:hypothetical protein
MPVRDLTPGAPGDDDASAEEIREQHPEGGTWRADALAASRHRRLADEIPPPLEDFDAERAAALCAEICREWLGDYAPGLALLPPSERRRAQALAAYARTLFDFARQRGLEGERLAQINRWEFTLETALSGQPVGQPVFVAMATCERERPWQREALDEIAAVARRRAMLGQAGAWTAGDDRRLARAALAALTGDAATRRGEEVVAAAIRLRMRGDLASDDSHYSTPPSRAGRAEAPEVEGASASRNTVDVSRLLRYVDLASRAIAGRARRGEAQLGVWARLALLLRARLGAAR